MTGLSPKEMLGSDHAATLKGGGEIFMTAGKQLVWWHNNVCCNVCNVGKEASDHCCRCQSTFSPIQWGTKSPKSCFSKPNSICIRICMISQTRIVFVFVFVFGWSFVFVFSHISEPEKYSYSPKFLKSNSIHIKGRLTIQWRPGASYQGYCICPA